MIKYQMQGVLSFLQLSKQGAASGLDASSNMTSTSCTTSLSSSPYTPSRSELIAKITPMDSVEEKVRELYFERMHVEVRLLL